VPDRCPPFACSIEAQRKPESMVNTKRRTRGSRSLVEEPGAFSPLDIHISPTLRRRMIELGLAPIPVTVVARHRSALRPTLFYQSLATKIVQ